MEWPVKELVEVTDLITCGVAKRPEYVDIGIPFLSAKNVKNGQVVWNDYKFVSEETHAELTKHNKPQKGDILYTRVGSFGEAAIVDKDDEFSVFVSLTLIKPQHQILNNAYLKYYLNSEAVKDMAKASINGVGVGNLNVGTVRKFPVPLPPISEQKRIVAILDQAFADIDRARELTERNLQNARELFESYLQQVSGEKRPLGEFVNIKTGKLNSNAAVEGGKYPFFTCSRDIYAINQFSFDCEAILLAGNNASGDFNVKHYKGKFDAYQRTYVITINDESTILYHFLYYQMLKSLKELKASSVGAGTKFLKLGMIKDLKISIPAINTQREILDTLLVLKDDVDKLENIYKTKIESLDELKKSILQKAFNGELTRDKDAA